MWVSLLCCCSGIGELVQGLREVEWAYRQAEQAGRAGRPSRMAEQGPRQR